jgi:hypothetical protein
MEDILDEVLFDIKPKKRFVRTTIKESTTDVRAIFEGDKVVDISPDPAEVTDDSPPEINASQVHHEPDGGIVMKVKLSISDKDMGTLEIGDKEFKKYGDVFSLINMFPNMNASNLKKVDTAPTSFDCTIEDAYTSANSTVELYFGVNKDQTITTTFSVDGQDFPLPDPNDLEASFKEFNKQYQSIIRAGINSELSGGE